MNTRIYRKMPDHCFNPNDPYDTETPRIALVYQAGIANVFRVDCLNLSSFGRNAKRLLQSDFRSCEWFARGMATAGCIVGSFHCNQAGDITNAIWNVGLDNAPFSDQFVPVWHKTLA